MTISLAPFVPSQQDVVKKMLELAQVNEKDTVFDLGCGDGRILITAIKDFNAKKAVGYEMRDDLYKNTTIKIQKEQLENRIKIFNEDLLNANITDATVITLYLTTSGNSRLKPKLSLEAQPGVKVVSHDFDIVGWEYAKRENFGGHTIYLYEIPDAFSTTRKRRRLSLFSRKRNRSQR
jgi:SAM-dependent methyltransferase